MNLNLLIHNLGFISGTIISLVFAIFVYLRDPKAMPNITFGLAFFCIAIFCGSHVLGVNIQDPYLSRNVLMWNLSVIWIACFLTHCTFFMIENAVQKQRFFLIFMYIAAFVLTVFYSLYPDAYLLPSHPKMYFPNYYVAGPWQWIMRLVFSLGVPTYFLVYLIYAYVKNPDNPILRNRLKYFFVAITVGYLIGSQAIMLVYDIPVDPAIASMAVPVLAIPLAYAILRYNLLDISILTQKAIFFGGIMSLSSFGIFLVGYTNFVLIQYMSDFPQWVMPVIGGSVATIIGVVVWNKFREEDVLKYEFITIMTHKLRTPLTSIKWSAEGLSSVVPIEGISYLEHIKDSAERLVQLTNVMANVSSEDQEKYQYHFDDVDMNKLTKSIIDQYKTESQERKINLKFQIPDENFIVLADETKLRFVMQSIIDNAFNYSPQGGNISVNLERKNKEIIFSVSDDGIGMSKNQQRLIFSRFYRTSSARAKDTEGLGIALYVSKRILQRHNGSIWAESEGENKGSTFSILLPIHVHKH